MARHDEPPDEAFVSFSESHPPPRTDEPAPPFAESSGADPEAFAFLSTAGNASIRDTAENAIAQQANRGAVILYVIGGAQLVFMLCFARINVPFPAQLAPDSQMLHPLLLLCWGLGLLIGGLFIALGFWARRDPLLASTLGLGIYAVVNLLDVFFLFGWGIALLPNGLVLWAVRGFIVVLLLDAIRAGVAYKRIVNKMIEEMRREH